VNTQANSAGTLGHQAERAKLADRAVACMLLLIVLFLIVAWLIFA
jgi:hypothetical protein